MQSHKDPLNRDDWRDNQWDEWGLHLPQWSHIKTGAQSGKGRRLVGDIEGDGLLYAQRNIKAGTKLWCIAAKDLDTGEKFYWGIEQAHQDCPYGDQVWETHALDFLREADMLLFHNGMTFDYPYMERYAETWGYPEPWRRPAKSWDSLVICKVVWPYDILVGPDLARIKAGKMPGQFLKRQSLEAWGYRTGSHKVDYNGGFEEWCPAMATYLVTGDLDGPEAIWRLVEKRVGWKDPEPGQLVWPEATFEYENQYARILHLQEVGGVQFDRETAIGLSRELTNEQRRIEKELVRTFGSWWQPMDDPETGTTTNTRSVKLAGEKDVELRRVSEKTGKELKPYIGPPQEHYTEGHPFVRIERTTFNPGSRDHLGQRLQAVFGWKPKKYGANGKPTVDETTLEEIPDAVMPEATRRLILDYFVVTKTLGMLSKGARSWLGMSDTDGRIHGRVDSCGAVTRRCTHSQPNLSQVPGVKKEKVVQPDGSKIEVPLHGLKGRYGVECRSLFTADDGWEQTGVDASSLELIVLGHYLEPTDGGLFRDRVCDPTRDPHAEHAELAGGITRADAKTTIYLIVFGGSAWKLSLDRGILVPYERVPELLGYRGLPALLRSLEKRFDADFVSKLDDTQKARLAYSRQVIVKLKDGIAGLDDLIKGVQKAAERGWLKAIDGSKLPVRKPHAALNALLQSGGAIICKLWKVIIHRKLAEAGLVWGLDYKQTLDVHDEIQVTHRPGLGPLIKRVAEEAIIEAGITLGLRGTLRTDGKTGRTWSDCH